MNIQKSAAFLYTCNEPKMKFKKPISFIIASKKKIPRNKFNKGSV